MVNEEEKFMNDGQAFRSSHLSVGDEKKVNATCFRDLSSVSHATIV